MLGHESHALAFPRARGAQRGVVFCYSDDLLYTLSTPVRKEGAWTARQKHYPETRERGEWKHK